MKKKHDAVFDIFGLLPRDLGYLLREEQIRDELNNAPERMRDAVKLYYQQNLTTSQVAALLDIRSCTASRHISNFRLRVRVKYLGLNGGAIL